MNILLSDSESVCQHVSRAHTITMEALLLLDKCDHSYEMNLPTLTNGKRFRASQLRYET